MIDTQKRTDAFVAAAFGRQVFAVTEPDEGVGSAQKSSPGPVTESDQAVARAFGREVPALTETRKRRHVTPEAELNDLLEEFRDLRVSRRGDSPQEAHRVAYIENHMIASVLIERVKDQRQLRRLRETVKAMRAEVPLGDAAPSGVRGDDYFRHRMVEKADDAVANAFGRNPKGKQ